MAMLLKMVYALKSYGSIKQSFLPRHEQCHLILELMFLLSSLTLSVWTVDDPLRHMPLSLFTVLSAWTAHCEISGGFTDTLKQRTPCCLFLFAFCIGASRHQDHPQV
jgi:hypothetical protein